MPGYAGRSVFQRPASSGASTPFFVTRNEVAVSRREGERFHLYRAFDFRTATRLFAKSGPLDQAFQLDPTAYEARMV